MKQGSCLVGHVNNFVRTQKLVMYSDQCGRQNRNIMLSVLCIYIVSSSEIPDKEIDQKFLVWIDREKEETFRGYLYSRKR